MTKLDFNIPFTGFSHHSFLSAAAAVHTYFTYPNAPAEYKNGWDYHITPRGMQEDWYFILGTMSGKNSLMDNFDDSIDNPDADTAYCDFCMKFLGYRYTVAESDFADALQKSIKQGNPAIALLKDRADGRNCFVLIGYDEEKPIAADHSGAQGDNTPPTYDEIEKLYVITEQCAPEYTLIDGLRNMERSLVSVLDGGIWDDLRSRFEHYWDSYKNKPLEETKALFERLMNMMWNFDHCHNVSETFAHKAYPALGDDRLAELCRKIDMYYSDTHDMQWAMQSLHDLRHWDHAEWCSKEYGMFLFAQMGIDRLKKNDENVLACVQEMIRTLERQEQI